MHIGETDQPRRARYMSAECVHADVEREHVTCMSEVREKHIRCCRTSCQRKLHTQVNVSKKRETRGDTYPRGVEMSSGSALRERNEQYVHDQGKVQLPRGDRTPTNPFRHVPPSEHRVDKSGLTTKKGRE